MFYSIEIRAVKIHRLLL